MANIFTLFNIKETSALTAPKTTLKDIREELTAELEAETAPIWSDFNAALAGRNWAITPSRTLCVAYWGKDLGSKVWSDIEARWLLLQATSAVYVAELSDTSEVSGIERARINKERKKALFAEVRGLLRYHGIDIGRDLAPSDLITIGETGIKYAFALGSGEAEAKAVGVAAFIKGVIYALLGKNSLDEVLDALCTRASNKAQTARKNTQTINWDAEDRPLFLKG